MKPRAFESRPYAHCWTSPPPPPQDMALFDKEGHEIKTTSKTEKKFAARAAASVIELAVEHQFTAGKLYASICSRPGQSGRCDGYILEGDELAFYLKRLTSKK